MLTSDSELNSKMSVKNKKSKVLPGECRICGAPAKYSYFGVISCQACKIFFKRNAQQGEVS
jgi:Zinc finger, C4 type (two domains)